MSEPAAAVTTDGERFLLIDIPDELRVHVVLNFFTELKAKVRQ